MINFMTFISSSMSLKEYRQAVVEAVEELNHEGQYGCAFSCYAYETSETQREEKDRAQMPINRMVGKCTFFFLIVDGEVGSKTREEYEIASQLFHNHQYPVFISILFKATPTKSEKKEGRIPFDDFRKQYLCNAQYGPDYSIMTDDRIYGYPFETADDIRQKVKLEIRKWMASPGRPLLDSKMGQDFSSDDFYEDEIRRNHCIRGIYFRRDFDNLLQAELENPKDVVYLYGATLSGKTRAVFHAISRINNGWFYKMKAPASGRDVVVQEINDVAMYLEKARPDLKQYLVFDDFDKYRFNDEELVNALGSLFFQVRNKECTIVITASVPMNNLPIANLFEGLSVVRIDIPPMSSAEHVEAIQMFRRNGLQIAEQNTRYHTTGALLIDLHSTKSNYTALLKLNDETLSQEDRLLRQMVLRTIKAFSIWHNSNMGDLDSMYEFCAYLIRRAAFGQVPVESLPREAFDHVIRILLRCPGIRDNSYVSPQGRRVKSIDIQEYVYRYFINYAGEIMLDNEVCSADDELNLIDQILSYVYEQNTPMIIDFGKIINRCEHRAEVSKYLFNIFQGIEAPRAGCSRWIGRLLEEKRALEEGIAREEFAEEVSQYYSKIFKQQIYGARDFAGALEYYMMARESLRDMFLLGALLVRTETPDQIEQVERLPEYGKFAQENFILYKLLLKKKDFGEGLAIVEQFQRQSESDYLDNRCLSRPQLPLCRLDSARFLDEFNLSWYQQAINSLFGLITTEEELDQICMLLRKEYLLCTGDYQIIQAYVANCMRYDKQGLTLIDLLNHVDIYALLRAFGRLYENDTKRMGDFIANRLIPAIPATIERGWTPRYRIRAIITIVANAFIRQFRKRGFRDVYNDIFLKLRSPENDMIFCDSFTYCAILDLEDCTLSDALNLFFEVIEPHSRSVRNPLVINRFILNALMTKAKREDSVHIREINRMFDRYGVERDRYSYNMILESLPFEEGLSLVGKMFESKQIQFDQYTLGSLIKTARDIPTALAFFDNRMLNLPGDVTIVRNFAGNDTIKRAIDPSIRQMVSSLQYAWLCLFEKRCSNESERRIIDACLASLENSAELSELLEDGRIYNVCLSNPSYIRNFAEAKAFLAEHPKFIFDGYSLAHCIGILNRDHRPHTHVQVVEEANSLFRYARDRKVEPSIIHYNNRIGLFGSHLEKNAVAFIFFRPDGTEILDPVTPIQYVQRMIDLGIGIDKFTVVELAKLPRMSDHVLRQLLELCREQAIHIDSKIQDGFLEKFDGLLTDETTTLMESLVLDFDPDLYNKQQIYRYINGHLSFREAVRKVNRRSLSSAILAYNALLSNFRKKEVEDSRKKKRRLPNLFRVGYTVYRNYILAFAKPISDTFSILASMAQTRSEMQWILQEIHRLNEEQHYQLRFSSYLLTAQLKLQTSLNDLKFAVEAHMNAGGEVTPESTDILLREIVSLANRAIRNGDLEDTALKYVEQLIDFLFHGGSCNSSVFSQMPLIRNYMNPTFVSRYTIINLLRFLRIREYVSCREIMETMIARYPRLFSERDGVATYLGKLDMPVSEFTPLFELLNGQKDPDIVEFRTELLCQLLEKQAAGRSLSYADFERLVGFWALGEYNAEQWNRIAVALIKLLKSFCRISPFDQIQRTVCTKAYQGRLVVGNFLQAKSRLEIPASPEFSIQDNTPETSIFFNNILLSRIRRLPSQKGTKQEKSIFEEIACFRKQHTLHSGILRRICQECNLSGEGLKRLVPLVENSPECVLVLLTLMANSLQGYGRMVWILRTARQNNISLKEELMSNLARSVMTCRYRDPNMSKVHSQLLYGLRTDDLRVYHFLIGDDILLPEANESVRIYSDIRELLLLGSDVYNSWDPEDSSLLIADACEPDREINSIHVNSMLSLYVKLCRHTARNVRREQREQWTSMILQLYRVDPAKSVDVSPLFNYPQILAKIREKRVSLVIPRRYLDCTILRFLDIPMEEKLGLILTAHALPVWLDSYENSEAILELFPELQRQKPEWLYLAVSAALDKLKKLETFERVLQFLDSNASLLRNTRCVTKLFEQLEGFLRTTYRLYWNLYKTRLNLRGPIRFSSLNCLFSHLKLSSDVEISVPERLQSDFRTLLAENRVFGDIVIRNSEAEIYQRLARHAAEGGFVSNDFVITKLLKVRNVRMTVIRDICTRGRFNLECLTTPEVPRETFRVRMTSEILDSLFSELNDMDKQKEFSKLDLFIHAIRTQGSSYLSDSNLRTVIASLRNATDYARFMDIVSSYEIQLTDSHWSGLARLLKRLGSQFGNETLDLIRQVYARVATNAETDTLMAGHFCCVQFAEIVFDAWGMTPVDRAVVLKAIGPRLLVEILCRDMYKLPDQYVKSLTILSGCSGTALDEKILRKIHAYEGIYVGLIDRREVNFWELRRVIRLWSRLGWMPQRHMLAAVLRYYVALVRDEATPIESGNPDTIRNIAELTVATLRRRLSYAEERNFASVKIFLKDLTDRIPKSRLSAFLSYNALDLRRILG